MVFSLILCVYIINLLSLELSNVVCYGHDPVQPFQEQANEGQIFSFTAMHRAVAMTEGPMGLPFPLSNTPTALMLQMTRADSGSHPGKSKWAVKWKPKTAQKKGGRCREAFERLTSVPFPDSH